MEGEPLFLDEKEHAMDSLAQSLAFLVKVEQNSYNWKWFVIAFHNALYSFMLLALKNTDSSGIWESEAKIITNGKLNISSKKARLIDFLAAFKWIQEKERMSGYINARPFTSPNIENISIKIKELNNDLRNQFVHFKPVLWGISPKYVADICYPLIEVIHFIVFKCGRLHINEYELNMISGYINAMKSLLEIHKKDEHFVP